MNISQPTASAIGSVDFAFLTPTEIRALSVKRIENPQTYDTLNHPIPGGLYDPVLGASGNLLYVYIYPTPEIQNGIILIDGAAAQHVT